MEETSRRSSGNWLASPRRNRAHRCAWDLLFFFLLLWIPRARLLDILDERLEAQFHGIDVPAGEGQPGTDGTRELEKAKGRRGLNVPKEVAMLTVLQLLYANDLNIGFVCLETLNEGFGEDKKVGASTVGRRGGQ